MRILWSIHLYPPQHNCGSEWMAHNINRFMISKGHEVRVIIHQDKDIFTPYEFEGVTVLGSKQGQIVDSYRWANIICTHLDFTQFTIIMAKEAKRPLVHFVHNDIIYSSIENNFGGVSAVYNSEWIKKSLGYKIPGYVLHPPCDWRTYDIQREPEAITLITLISLNYMKGGMWLYELAQAMPERKFIGVVGSYDSPGDSKIEQWQIISRLKSLPNVEIVQNSPDILSVYKRTRILIMPSYYESYGRTATEAMCSGIPVICTPTPGLKENCSYAGIYCGTELEDPERGKDQVTLGTVKDWKYAIEKLDNLDEYKKVSLLSRQRSRELDPVKELEGLEQFFLNTRFK